MSYLPGQVFYTGTASGASTSSILDMGGRSYDRIAVYAVTMSTGALVTIYGAINSTSTFMPLSERGSAGTFTVLTMGTANSGNWCIFSAPPTPCLKFVTSDVVSGGVSYLVVGSD